LKALEGIKVLDFSQGAAGPYASMVLGDFGAEIIKVEPPVGDWARTLGPPFIHGESATYLSLNRNKRSIVLDLKFPEGKSAAQKMAENVDVIIESFRPGVMEKMGLGYEQISAQNPKVVYCSISGFGQRGPWKYKPGVDGIIQAVSGFMSVTGSDEMAPVKAGSIVADMMGGALASNGILTALLARGKTGKGQKVEQSLLDAMLTNQSVGLSMYFASGNLPQRMGSQAPYAVPNGAFSTKDGYIMLAANLEPKWQLLCRLLNKMEWLDDYRFRTNKNRVENRAVLVPLLEEVLRTKTSQEWLELLEASDILCAPITTYEDVSQLEQVHVNQMIIETEHPYIGGFRHIGIPQKLSGTPGQIDKHPPMLGEHTTDILEEFDFSKQVIQNLVENQVARQLYYDKIESGGLEND
jgi:crotonobetainyl-CoA:carnitine CoA-transferase CaiB-like acyl-CoA transferase